MGNAALWSRARTGTARALGYFALWLIIDQSTEPANLVVGVIATAAATWASMCLLPPATGRVRVFTLLRLLPHFLRQSVVAGVDVARRALSPRLRVTPGFVDYPVMLPRGSARNAFELISTLLPGSVAADETEASIEYHCLDVQQPVVEQLAVEERTFAAALVPGRRHG